MADQDNSRDFNAVGISISESQTGRIRIACPFCGPNRIHRPHERCLSVDTDKGLYHCYHCGESGYVPTKGEQKARAKPQKAASFLDRFVESHLEDKIRIILALDNDERGIELRNELIRRLDPERCLLVEWPEDCKDANDVLMRHGEERVRECIEAAHEIPLVGIQTAEDVEEELWQLFRQGMQRGAAARIAGMDELITFETGRFNVHR